MESLHFLSVISVLAPVVLFVSIAVISQVQSVSMPILWRVFQAVSIAAIIFTFISLTMGTHGDTLFIGTRTTKFSLILAIFVQLLGTVIGAFSARYLEGESGQRRYIGALASVLASVQLLLMADHWLVLIAAWAGVGMALHYLLCFYPERPFALLAAHKKRLSDRLADLMLLGAAALTWMEVGSGSLSVCWEHIAKQGMSIPMQASAVLLVLAVVLRTALLPVHGWLIQVMEAPTPVSALLHAGVVNLGGFVLILFAPMLEHAAVARALLLFFGLATAVLAGMVMLTRISVKVRLAWSTVAQMGFMLVECALGLYILAGVHLIGHSLYKANAFLSASTAVRQTGLQVLRGTSSSSGISFALAPILSISTVLGVAQVADHASWPWWWSVVIGLAWAPSMWLPAEKSDWQTRSIQIFFALLVITGLTAAAALADAVDLGLHDSPHSELGVIAMTGMAALYLFQALLQVRPELLTNWHRWSYAGFYLDEAYTRLAFRLWPTRWTAKSTTDVTPRLAANAGS